MYVARKKSNGNLYQFMWDAEDNLLVQLVGTEYYYQDREDYEILQIEIINDSY